MHKRIVLAISVIYLGVAAADAKSTLLNFDGNLPEQISITEMVKTTKISQDDTLPHQTIYPEAIGMMDQKVNVIIKIKDAANGRITEKEIVCGKTGNKSSCQDKVTGTKLQKDEIFSLLIGRYVEFDNSPYKKDDISLHDRINKKPYYTCSSGHSFYCVDFCRQWVIVETGGSWTVGPNGPQWTGTERKECADWSYDCTDQGPGTCSGQTTPPPGGFTHPN